MNDEDTRTRRQVRVLRLLTALLEAGVEEVSIGDFHAFAFFAEALAPLWGVVLPVGDVLKEEDGPHFPALQRELDHLVGRGVVSLSRLTSEDHGGRWRLDAAFSLNVSAASRLLAVADAMPDEDEGVYRFLTELAFGFAEIPAGLRDKAAKVDAAWSAPGTANGRFIELDGRSPTGEPRRNHSADAARHFQTYASAGVTLTAAEQTSLYMSLMRRRAGA